jgi:hypothetical protein
MSLFIVLFVLNTWRLSYSFIGSCRRKGRNQPVLQQVVVRLPSLKYVSICQFSMFAYRGQPYKIGKMSCVRRRVESSAATKFLNAFSVLCQAAHARGRRGLRARIQRKWAPACGSLLSSHCIITAAVHLFVNTKNHKLRDRILIRYAYQR